MLCCLFEDINRSKESITPDTIRSVVQKVISISTATELSLVKECDDLLGNMINQLTHNTLENREQDCSSIDKVLELQLDSDCCTICFGKASHADDLIVSCGQCNVAVHQSCYGIAAVPEGEWKCSKCSFGEQRPVNCMLCGRTGGAMKPMKASSSSKWVHLLCCWWDPDTAVDDTTKMEPVVFVREVPKLRSAALTQCELCGGCEGYCIRCSYETCARPFHPVCARRFGYLSMDLDSGIISQQAFCDRHKEVRICISDIVHNTLDTKELTQALGKAQNTKLQELMSRLRGSEFYEAMDNVTKDIVAVLRRALEQSEKRTVTKNDDDSTGVIRAHLNCFLEQIPQLDKVYASSTLRQEELCPDYRSTSNTRPDKCSVCEKQFTYKDVVIYCQDKENRHAQHAQCVNRGTTRVEAVKAIPAPVPQPKRRRSKQKKHPEFVKTPVASSSVTNVPLSSGKCGLCGTNLDFRGLVRINDTKSKRIQRQAKDNEKISSTTVDRGPSSYLPSLLDISIEQTTSWLTLVESGLELWESGSSYTEKTEAIVQPLNSACDLAAVSGDKYARLRLKKVLSWLKSGAGPVHALLVVLVRDYKRLIRQRETHDTEVAEQARLQLEKARLEQEKRKAEEQEERQAELLLKKQQAEIKESLKRKKKPAKEKKIKVKKQMVSKPQVAQVFQSYGDMRLSTKPKTSTTPPRATRCNRCVNCKSPDCRVCVSCLDMKKYGGSGTRRRCCIKRSCLNPRATDLSIRIPSPPPVQKLIKEEK